LPIADCQLPIGVLAFENRQSAIGNWQLAIGNTMNLYDRIPNNVNLSEDKKLQRALEKWLPNYLDWWREMGPEGFQ